MVLRWPVVRGELGGTLGSYRLEKIIGRGGISVVYLATHLHLDREVALKLLAEELTNSESFRERLLRESQAVARLDAVIP